MNLDSSSLMFYKNNSQIGNTITGLTGTYLPGIAGQTSSSISINFGQNPTFSGNSTAGTFTDSNGKGLFKYQPPAGFLALCEDNLPAPAISDPGKHFKTVLWTGDSNKGRSITGLGFKPDLVWIKGRNATYYHEVYDSIRKTPVLFSNVTDSEITINTLNSFDADGFTVSTQTGYNGTNNSGQNYVAWCWKAGNTTTTNTNGSITSTVSVNQQAGFSIVSYTGNGVLNATVGHGLPKAPNFTIVKSRTNATRPWAVESTAFTGRMLLNTTDAAAAFSHARPYTDKVLTLEAGTTANESGATFIAYCWTEIAGFSKFGSYVGNGSADGPFVYCGFKPAFVIIKRTDSAGSWVLKDNSRNSTNPVDLSILANTSDTEYSSNSPVDFLSNGFKLRSASLNDTNGTFIFAAWAESPFQTANAK
jgi:hypothetical protein